MCTHARKSCILIVPGHVPYIVGDSWLQNTTAKINQTGLEELPGDQPKIVKMGLAAEEAAVSTNVYWLDLVRFEPEIGGFVDRGLVVPPNGMYNPDNRSVPASTFMIFSVDEAVRTGNAGDITLLDRSYLGPGQIVGSASNLGGQIGVVTAATTVLDLIELGDPTAAAVRAVSPSDLRRVRGLSLGDYVVSLDVDVLFDDGAVCTVTDAESRKLRSAEKQARYRPQTNTRFYPGQRVTGDPHAVFKASRWLYGHWKPSRQLGTICRVEMAGVLVYWLASALWGTDRQLVQESAPPAYQSPRNLTLFCPASDCAWGVADRCFLREPPISSPAENHACSPDDSCSSDEELEELKFLFVRHRRTRREAWKKTELELPMSVSDTRTTDDVLWQDGTVQHGAPSTSVVPFEIMNEHEFFPGQYVVDNHIATTTNDDTAQRLGIVRSLNCKDQTVHVSWFKAASGVEEAREVECDDTVSAYDLGRDYDHRAFYGDVVVRLLSSGLTGSGCATPVQQPLARGHKNIGVTSDLSWVGRVVGLPDGQVQVKWGDGSMATDNYHPNPVEDGNMEGPGDLSNAFGRATTWSWGLGAAVRFVTRLAAETLAQGKSYLAKWWPPSISESPVAGENVEVSMLLSSSGESLAMLSSIAAVRSIDATAGSHDSPDEGKKATDATGDGGDPFRLPRFDIVQSPSDHHYLEAMNPQDGGNEKTWVKTVQKEWKILMNDLPDTIYVCAFKDRMDLLRAVIVGASGTPYQDGLFFFDLQLPLSYPAAPPQVYYHSFGLRLNPNLYASGTVCLSLLNTFGGDGTEVWSRAMSTLLQVLVSIQGLVLNNQPYYNEAGYEDLVGTPEGRRNALPYNEKAYLLTLRAIFFEQKRGFEEFIKDHFRHRGRFVLRACEAYLRGCIVGTLTSDASPTVENSERPCSAGLRLALTNVVPSLMEAIREVGDEE
ncbi:hypothetical protein VPH35_136441 [Triticum aestivum]